MKATYQSFNLTEEGLPSLSVLKAYQKVFVVLAIVIRGGHTLFISEPGQHLLHVLQVLVKLDGLFQFRAAGSCEGLETSQLLVELGLRVYVGGEKSMCNNIQHTCYSGAKTTRGVDLRFIDW